jgi:hypothetical protein
MPTTLTPTRSDSPPEPTHARGKWFFGALVGVWPLALALAALAVALGLPVGITVGSALAAALAIDFLVIVSVFEVDDGDSDFDGSTDDGISDNYS